MTHKNKLGRLKIEITVTLDQDLQEALQTDAKDRDAALLEALGEAHGGLLGTVRGLYEKHAGESFALLVRGPDGHQDPFWQINLPSTGDYTCAMDLVYYKADESDKESIRRREEFARKHDLEPREAE